MSTERSSPEDIRTALLALVALKDVREPRREAWDTAWARARDVLGVVSPTDALERVFPIAPDADLSSLSGFALGMAQSIRDYGSLEPKPGAVTAQLLQALTPQAEEA